MPRRFAFAALAASLVACSNTTLPIDQAGVVFLNTGDAVGTPGWILDDSLTVRVIDRSGHPEAAHWIHWSAEVDGAWFSADSTLTDSDGIAGVEFTPGWSLGAQQVRATVGSHSATYTVTATSMAMVEVEVFDRRVCGLDDDGRMWCWAKYSNEVHPKRLDDTRRPIPVDTPLRFTSLIAAPQDFYGGTDAEGLCAVSTTKELWCANATDFPGPFFTASSVPTLHRVSTPVPVADIALGGNRAARKCILDPDGYAWCRGPNDQGQLGNGTTVASDAWEQVAGNIRFAEIRVGWRNTCALALNGKPYCWGPLANELEGVAAGPVTSPTPVVGDMRLVKLSEAGIGFCGLTAFGAQALRCWGNTFPARRLDMSMPSALEFVPAVASDLAGDPSGGRLISDGLLYRFGYDGSCCDYEYYGANTLQKDITGAVRLLSPTSYYWCIEHRDGAIICSDRDDRPVAVPLEG